MNCCICDKRQNAAQIVIGNEEWWPELFDYPVCPECQKYVVDFVVKGVKKLMKEKKA